MHRALLALTLAALLSGCEEKKCPEVTAAPFPSASVVAPLAESPASSPVRIQPSCINTNTDLMVHVAIDATYTGAPPNRLRTLWQIRCSKKTFECEGVSIGLNHETISVLDVTNLVGAKLVAMQGQVATVRWGPLRTFTIDFAERKVRYAESSANTEGRGEGACS